MFSIPATVACAAAKDLKPCIGRVSFLIKRWSLLHNVVEVFDLQNLDQPEPATQDQQDVHVLEAGQVCAALVDHYLVRPAIAMGRSGEEHGCRSLVAALREHVIKGICRQYSPQRIK